MICHCLDASGVLLVMGIVLIIGAAAIMWMSR